MDMKRLKKQMDFILEIDKEKNIKRQTLITDEAVRRRMRSTLGIWL